MPNKRFELLLPEPIWNEFYKVFPGNGERSAFLKHMISFAIELGSDRRLINQVKRLVMEELEDG